MQYHCTLLIGSTSLLLSGCLGDILDRDCHYQPVHGVAQLTPVDPDTMSVYFQVEEASKQRVFNQFSLNPQALSMPRKAAPDGGQYQAIANIRTSGQCAPYIIFLSEPLPQQNDAD